MKYYKKTHKHWQELGGGVGVGVGGGGGNLLRSDIPLPLVASSP